MLYCIFALFLVLFLCFFFLCAIFVLASSPVASALNYIPLVAFSKTDFRFLFFGPYLCIFMFFFFLLFFVEAFLFREMGMSARALLAVANNFLENCCLVTLYKISASIQYRCFRLFLLSSNGTFQCISFPLFPALYLSYRLQYGMHVCLCFPHCWWRCVSFVCEAFTAWHICYFCSALYYGGIGIIFTQPWQYASVYRSGRRTLLWNTNSSATYRYMKYFTFEECYRLAKKWNKIIMTRWNKCSQFILLSISLYLFVLFFNIILHIMK